MSLISVVHLDLRISPRISEKIRNDPSVIFRGLGEAKNLVTLYLQECKIVFNFHEDDLDDRFNGTLP